MSVFDLFSKRQKKLRGELPDVYVYDAIPAELRSQIVQITHETLGDRSEYLGGNYSSHSRMHYAYKMVVQVLRKEYGTFCLSQKGASYGDQSDYYVELSNFILTEKNAERVLDAIELICRVIERTVSQQHYRDDYQAGEHAVEAIKEINARFKEHGLGYEYDGEIIRIDAELVHAEAVKPALALLRDQSFKGAEEEFLKAYEHYRKQSYKEALNEALKAFESTLKTICDKQNWEYAKGDPAKKLLDLCFDKELIPEFWQSQFGGLRAILENGIPTARNKLSGHGQGANPTEVPGYLVAYVLHLTASAIVFLISAANAKP